MSEETKFDMAKRVHLEKFGNTERYSFSKIKNVLAIPNLISIQKNSYNDFIQNGIKEVLQYYSPIVSQNGKLKLTFLSHTLADKPKNSIQYCKDMAELRKSKNLDKVHRYYKSMASDCHILVDMETPNKKVKCEVIDNMYHSINDTHELKQVQQAAIDFQTEVITLKSKYLATHCPKCEKLQKEYEYILNEIQDMREEIKEQREAEIERVKAEIENPPIIDFMNKYFEGKTRIKLGDVAKMWKADKGKSIKQDDLAEMLEESGNWWVGNSHNLRYANYGPRPEKDNE